MRVTRNADIDVNEALYDHDMDFRNVMEELCRKRKKLMPVRAEFSYDASPELVKRMLDYLELSDSSRLCRAVLLISALCPHLRISSKTGASFSTIRFHRRIQ